MFDTDKSGTISIKELKNISDKLNLKASTQEVEELMNSLVKSEFSFKTLKKLFK